MILPLFLTLVITVYFDSRLLRRTNHELFKINFYIRTSSVVLFLILSLLLIIAIEERGRVLAVIIFIILLPLYLITRHRFLRALEGSSEKFYLAADCFGVILYWIFGGVIISTLAAAFFQLILEFESQLGEVLISAMGSSLLLVYLVYKASARFSPKGFLYNVGLRRGNSSLSRLVFLPALTGFVFALISATVIFFREKDIQTPLSEIIAETQSGHILLLFLFMAVATAPLIEEIVFRGYFFHVLKELKGLRSSIVVISLSFAILHVGQYWGDWMAILMITLIGFCLTAFRAWTHSTLSSCVMHYLYNGTVTFIPIVMIALTNPAFFRYQANYAQLDDREKERLLNEALQKDPRLAEAYYELAVLYMEAPQRLALALEAIDQALAIYPQDRLFLETKARILEEMRRYKDALVIRRQLMDQGG